MSPSKIVAFLLVLLCVATFTIAATTQGAKTQENVSVVVNLNLNKKNEQKTQQPEAQQEAQSTTNEEPKEEPKKEEPKPYEPLKNGEKSSEKVNFELAAEN